MQFEKPLKVFLSYSHADEPKLFNEFKKQLKSLEEDGIIRLWADTDIAAGWNWDREIKKSLDQCQIFLALTSASFNDSGYIRGIEMSRAWERHVAGDCRIIPVMWRQWRPTDRLRALQFLLPNLEQDVVNAPKPDNVLYQLTVKLAKTVDEMTAGQG